MHMFLLPPLLTLLDHDVHAARPMPACLAARWVQDECRGWDVNELVFSPALWGTYQVCW